MIIWFAMPSVLGVLHRELEVHRDLEVHDDLLRVYGAHRDLEVPGGHDGALASEGGFALN